MPTTNNTNYGTGDRLLSSCDKLVCNQLLIVTVSPSRNGLLLHAIKSFKHITWETFVHTKINELLQQENSLLEISTWKKILIPFSSEFQQYCT